MKISNIFPKSYKKKLISEIEYCGFDKKEAVFEKIHIYGALLSILSGFIAFLITFRPIFSVFFIPAFFILYMLLIRISLYLISESRAKQVEQMLPDCLQLIASNMRAGMTLDKAIWMSARPELGILEEEIRKVGAGVIGGKSFKNSLNKMTTRIKSSILNRTVNLIIDGLDSGGEIAKLLDQTADNLRSQQMLQNEVKTSVLMYTIFIFIASVFGAPFLFSISLYYVDVMNSMWVTPPQNIYGIKTISININPTEMFYFSIIAITIITIFSSILIAIIQHGDEKKGIKYMPIMISFAFVVFFLSKIIISSIFSSFI